jgi:hypothetical protein
MGFEPTTPVFERPKTVHTLDGAATVIGTGIYTELSKAKRKAIPVTGREGP